MAKLEGFRICNFKVLKEVTIGKLRHQRKASALTPMTAVIGKNGVGKSTLFDAFGFLADCLKNGVEEACNLKGRGGFDRIRSQGVDGPIEFEVCYKEEGKTHPVTYELAISLDNHRRPYVQKERLLQREKGQKYGPPFVFLLLDDGKGVVWRADYRGLQIDEAQQPIDLLGLMGAVGSGSKKEELRGVEVVELEDNRKLGLTTLGSLKQHPRIAALRRFIEGWYLSYFTPDAARMLPLSGAQKHLNIHGNNIGNVVQYLEQEHPRKFKSILKNIADKIPGIHKIDTEKSADGRLLLRFNDKGFTDPFYAQQMSDGTLKVFAYLLLLEDPAPPPFICIEEPENGLYHKLLETLANEFRKHATIRKSGPQILITTHQPYFVDALSPKEVWVLTKEENGFSKVSRASEDAMVQNMTAEGLPLGGLWHSDYLDAR
jgi:predicted ATPase